MSDIAISLAAENRDRVHGDWYGMAKGERLPVGHSQNLDLKSRRYFDYYDRGKRASVRYRRWAEDVQATGRIIIQKTRFGPEEDREGYLVQHCAGYVGAYYVTNVRLDEKHRVFSCDIGEQFAE